MRAPARPSEVQVGRAKAAPDVFPLAPVTAAITCGWRGNNAAAANAKARRASWTLTKAMSDGSDAGGRRSAMTAAAPAASACATKLRPSVFPPLTATKRSPGLTMRLSAVTPVISSAAKRASLAASAVRRSAGFILFRSATFAAAYGPGIPAMRVVGFPTRFSGIRNPEVAPFAVRRGFGLPAAGARQDQLIGSWEVEARLQSEQGCDASDDGTADRHCVPSGRGEAVCVGGRLRLIEHDEEKVARLVGRRGGATESPCRNAMVTVLRSAQRMGTSGSALSGNSVRSRSSCPIFRRNHLWCSIPRLNAIRAVPMLEEYVKISGTVSTRLCAWKS